MPQFAANLSMLFTERPLRERFTAARKAGFEHVEVLFPYELSVEQLQEHLAETSQRLVLINTPAGDWAAGERGFGAVPGAEAQFREGALRAVAYARAVPVCRVHVMAGLAEGAEARRVFMEHLRWLTGEAPDVEFTIEPISPVDIPGYFLDDFEVASETIGEVGAPNLSLQFDAYHAHRITGDVPGTWAGMRHLVRHVQVASAEGRHEPGPGAIDYPAFFAQLDAEGYAGVVSGEYIPRGHTEEGLGWAFP